MEKLNFDYSVKNIPIPSRNDYLQRLIEKTEQFLRRMRWKAFFFLNPDTPSSSKNTYGFKSAKNPPPIDELKEFEDGMLHMIQSTKFKTVNNPFLNKLGDDTKRIKDETKLLIAADKTTNFYKLERPTYDKLLKQNITKSYKKAQPSTVQAIHNENKHIATKLGIEDRVEATANRDAFITLKDHKPNFTNKPTCRLINPTKSEIGKISKEILDRINRKIIKATKFNQWKNTSSVIKWFENIENKEDKKFISFDVVEFYPSITQDLLTRALNFASTHDNITKDEKDIIIHAKNSILIYDQQPWQKKGDTTFDVTMGSFDGAETCELVGSFLLSQLQHLNINVGLYRDDGLATVNASPRQTENIKKQICRIFHNNGLRITIEANKHAINFLDVTLNLHSNTYQPFTKPDTVLQYVHRESNHPPITTKNIPDGINKRLSTLSSDKASFEQAAPPYQKALDDSGYRHTLEYKPTTTTNRRHRQRNNILWYNPPYSKNVSTNIGHRFLTLVDKHFPQNHPLRKIFNRNNIKISYSCMNNTKQIINIHNKRIIDSQQQDNNITANNNNNNSNNHINNINNNNNNTTSTTKDNKTCNCRRKDTCPLNGNCLQKSVIYQATVTRQDNNTTESYVGLTENEFKTRYRNHTSSFRHTKHRHSTELSKYIWTLKDKDIDYTISWKILSSCRSYNSSSKRCNLCIKEKFFIICRPHLASLNKRNELVSACRHRNKALLIST